MVLWLRHVALPNVDHYREDIVASIEKASGADISVQAIRGGWGGLRPSLTLEGFRIVDRKGRAALAFDRAELTLSWWTLARGELRFHDVDFHRPALVLSRGTDGRIYLADRPLTSTTPEEEGGLTEWLLAQPRFGVHDATLVWRDDLRGAPEVQLTGVEIAVRNDGARHRAAITAVPPRELARRVELRVDAVLARAEGRWSAKGDLYAQSLQADLALLRTHLPVPETLRQGVGSLRVWAAFAPGGLQEATADVSLRDVTAQLASDVLPLELATLSGRATYRAEPHGFQLKTEGLRFRLASGVEAQPGGFSLKRTAEPGRAPRGEVKADGIDLKIATTLLEYFPVPRDMKGQVLRFAPRGRISDATLTWSTDAATGANAYALKGRFEDLGFNAVDAWPGVTGLTGTIEGSESGGALRLDSRKASLELSRILRAPILLDTLEARAEWRHVDGALEVRVAEARFSNADAEGGRLEGLWRALPGSKEKSPGYVDIKGTLARADARHVGDYLPDKVAATREWLDRAIRAGEATDVVFELKGDLWNFPYGREAPGRFLVAGAVRNGRLAYHPSWPSVDAIQGRFRFENRAMEIRADRATIFASRASGVAAVIPDLGADPPMLAIDADVETTGGDSVRFLRESPLVDGPGAFTRAVAIDGPARLKLHFDYPLWGASPVKVAGEYRFAGASASFGRALVLANVQGPLSFTESGVRAPGISGTLFGHPATLRMATQSDGRILTTLDGRIDAASMKAHVSDAIVARMAGAAAWSARLVSDRLASELTVTSDLKGLAVGLPAPLSKAAAESRPLALRIEHLGTDDEVATASVAGGVHVRAGTRGTAGARRWHAALKFGAPIASEPVRDGLWLYGALGELDVDAWQSVFAGEAAPASAPAPAHGVELRGIDLKLGRVRYQGRDFRDLAVALQREGVEWSGRLESPLVAGDIRWNPEGRGRLHARLARLSLGEPVPGKGPEPPPKKDTDLPALDVEAERFEFRGRWLGRLDLEAEPSGEEWRIDRLDIANEHTKLNSRGGSRKTGAGAITTLAMKVDSNDLNALLGQFGYGDYLKRGSGHLEGNLVWPGLAHEFSLASLSGAFAVEGRRGQFAKIEPGAGKLLGLLSLQSLPRRALLDFRDVFSEGFAFDRIHGNVKVAKGILLTDDFEITGTSAFVSLAGEVSLPAETQALTMRVVPEVSEGIALAATVFGTPVLGLSTLLVSKLLKNPFGKVVAYEYLVTGSWDNPSVTRTSGPPSRADASPPESPAAAAKPANPK